MSGLPGLDVPAEQVRFEPSRAAGLARLDRFVSRTGRHYARTRNFDYGPDHRSNVSVLSPWLRHRVISEQEVLHAVLARHSPSAAEKFVQEVFWRTYFKGWLEHHPSVWTTFEQGVQRARDAVEANAELRSRYMAAVTGQTGIAPFDAWVQELVETGYLHNHARMWFASIWIFTLRLPWELGAAFFLAHLVDADPASNTLSWRWVGGLHTKGKTYLARPDNIATYTEGRFHPRGQLATHAPPLTEAAEHPRVPLRPADVAPDGPYLLLVTAEDVGVETVIETPPEAVLGLTMPADRGVEAPGARMQAFTTGVMREAVGAGGQVIEAVDWAPPLLEAAGRAGVRTVVTGFAPVGPVAGQLARARTDLTRAGIDLRCVRRAYDTTCWPHATRGFFGLKKKIPQILSALGLTI